MAKNLPRGWPLSKKLKHLSRMEGKCRVYSGARLKSGYGIIYWQHDTLLAHRAAWIADGSNIPDGMLVLHKCDNPPCIRKSHLFLGTHADNVADKIAKGRQTHGEAHGPTKITSETALAIFSDQRPHREMRAIYGVTAKHIRDIKSGRLWWRVTGAAKPPPEVRRAQNNQQPAAAPD